MALVKVRMYATVREASGAPEVELDASTLSELLSRLVSLYGRKLETILSGYPEDPEKLVVLINGRNMARARAALRLRPGDEVSIFPPVSGG